MEKEENKLGLMNGRLGQVLGPFDSSDLLGSEGKISVFTPETTTPTITKLGIQATTGTIVKINGVSIKIGITGIYELDEVVKIKSISFPNGADENTIIDFIY